ncbi:MAG: cation:proton antiporter [Firmicutes bacterium]|nr:cation:proton antiporter [Bacillota bacterium]
MAPLILEVGLALALVSLASLLAAKARVSMVSLVILAGMAVGPHAPKLGVLDLRFLKSTSLIEFLGQIGILFLLLHLGLEFSLSRLTRAGRSILVGGTGYLLINLSLALFFARLMGWPMKETLVGAGIMAISSSAIAAKVLIDLKRAANPETEMILGIILFEDIFLAIYLSAISGIIMKGAASVGEAASAALVSVGIMAAVFFIGRKTVPLLNRLLNISSDEIFLLVTFSGLMLVAGLSGTVHLEEAIGALILGLLLSETDHRRRIERLILPFRDVFGAFFFFSFGLAIDPFALGGVLWLVLGAVALTLGGNIAAGMLAGRAGGLSPRASWNIGLTILSRGEFSIILAKLAKVGGLMPFLQPFAALYVLILAVLGPVMAGESRRLFHLSRKIMGKTPGPGGVKPGAGAAG